MIHDFLETGKEKNVSTSKKFTMFMVMIATIAAITYLASRDIATVFGVALLATTLAIIISLLSASKVADTVTTLVLVVVFLVLAVALSPSLGVPPL